MATNIKTILFLSMAIYMCGQREAKILRNNALMNRMVSNFHRDNGPGMKTNNKNTNSLEWQELKQRDKESRVNDRAGMQERASELQGRHERSERIVFQDHRKDRYGRSRAQEGNLHQQQSERQHQQTEQIFPGQYVDKTDHQRTETSHQDKTDHHEVSEIKPNHHLIEAMKNILCKHFPAIPCYLIIKDATLSGLIDKSIKQINHKKMSTPASTAPTFVKMENQHVRYSNVDSEDLSSFLKVRAPTVMYKNNRNPKDYPQEYLHKTKAAEIREKQMRQQENHRQALNEQANEEAKPFNENNLHYKGRKKLRKFYPHKYKDNMPRLENAESHADRLSLSLEGPVAGANVRRKRKHLKHNEGQPPGVWRIDYMKHGEPSLPKINYAMVAEEPFKAEMTKNFDKNVLNDNRIDQTVRRDILHPDLYIKTNLGRSSR